MTHAPLAGGASTGRIGIVTGLVEEADAVRAVRPDLAIDCQGPGPRRARRAAEALADGGAALLVSAGIAGGLEPARQPGDLLLGVRILGPDGRVFDADPELCRRMSATARARGLPLFEGDLVGSDRVVPSPEAKLALHMLSGAAAVDMESHAVAAVAAERGLPFAVLRAISDSVRATLPRAVIGAVTPDGRRRPWAAVGGLARRPWQVGGAIRLGRDAARARAALAAAVALLPNG